MWLDRGKDRCMHYHALDNPCIESLLKEAQLFKEHKKIYKSELATPIKHIMQEGWSLQTLVVWTRLSSQQSRYLFEGSSRYNLCQYATSMVCWLCLYHRLGWSGGSCSSIQSIHLSFAFMYLVYWLVIYTSVLTIAIHVDSYEQYGLHLSHASTWAPSVSHMRILDIITQPIR